MRNLRPPPVITSFRRPSTSRPVLHYRPSLVTQAPWRRMVHRWWTTAVGQSCRAPSWSTSTATTMNWGPPLGAAVGSQLAGAGVRERRAAIEWGQERQAAIARGHEAAARGQDARATGRERAARGQEGAAKGQGATAGGRRIRRSELSSRSQSCGPWMENHWR